MIEGRDEQEHVVPRLAVVDVFDLRRVHERTVRVQDGFRKARRAARKVDGGVVLVGKLHVGGDGGIVVDLLVVTLCKSRHHDAAHKEEDTVFADLVGDLLDAPDEFGAEEKDVDFGKIDAVSDLLRRIAVVERHRERARL